MIVCDYNVSDNDSMSVVQTMVVSLIGKYVTQRQ